MRRPTDEQIARLKEKAYQIKTLALNMITYGRASHSGGILSEGERIECLYFSELCYYLKRPDWGRASFCDVQGAWMPGPICRDGPRRLLSG